MLDIATTDIFIDVFKHPVTQFFLFLQLVTKDFCCQLFFNVNVTDNPMLHWVPYAKM